MLAGGILAAVIGPNLVRWVEGSFQMADYIGSYLALAAIYCILLMLVIAMRLPSFVKISTAHSINKRQLLTQPTFITAVACGALSYAVMRGLMTATPLSMQHHGHTLGDAVFSTLGWQWMNIAITPLLIGTLLLVWC